MSIVLLFLSFENSPMRPTLEPPYSQSVLSLWGMANNNSGKNHEKRGTNPCERFQVFFLGLHNFPGSGTWYTRLCREKKRRKTSRSWRNPGLFRVHGYAHKNICRSRKFPEAEFPRFLVWFREQKSLCALEQCQRGNTRKRQVYEDGNY